MDIPVKTNVMAQSIVPYNKAGRLPTCFRAKMANKEKPKLVNPT